MNDPINQTPLKLFFSFPVKYLGAFPACLVTNLSKREVTFQCDFCRAVFDPAERAQTHSVHQGGQEEFQRKERGKEALVATQTSDYLSALGPICI